MEDIIGKIIWISYRHQLFCSEISNLRVTLDLNMFYDLAPIIGNATGISFFRKYDLSNRIPCDVVFKNGVGFGVFASLNIEDLYDTLG